MDYSPVHSALSETEEVLSTRPGISQTGSGNNLAPRMGLYGKWRSTLHLTFWLPPLDFHTNIVAVAVFK